MTFPECEAGKRTDSSFREMTDEDHHIQQSHLCDLKLDLVSSFPLDYMHLVCLGVVRRLLLLWKEGPLTVRLSGNVINTISQRLTSFSSYLPREFSRKPRSLLEIKQWKATEFRHFLMALSVSISLLLNSALYSLHLDYIEKLLIIFVKNFAVLYGDAFVGYNADSLIHIVDDARKFVPLDSVSAFSYENYLRQLKKMVRRPQDPLSQIFRRLREKEQNIFVGNVKEKSLFKKMHQGGPLPAGFHLFTQYKQCIGEKLFISCHRGDNCVLVMMKTSFSSGTFCFQGSAEALL